MKYKIRYRKYRNTYKGTIGESVLAVEAIVKGGCNKW